MKTSIVIVVVVLGLMVFGCGNTTYLSLTESNREQVEEQLKYDEKDEDVGAEVTLSLNNSTEINGELLFVRDTTLIICSKYGVPENQLVRIIYPINSIQNKDIQELSIERGPYTGKIFIGAGLGMLGGVIVGWLIGEAITNSLSWEEFGLLLGLGSSAGLITGGIMGATSYDDIILQEIPPGYDFSLLKPLARYPDEEPEYLKAIE